MSSWSSSVYSSGKFACIPGTTYSISSDYGVIGLVGRLDMGYDETVAGLSITLSTLSSNISP